MYGKRIRELREGHSMTQEQLGRQLGVLKSTVSNWEREYTAPNFDNLIQISKIFAVSTDYILNTQFSELISRR